MTNVLLLPDPATLAVVDLEIDEATKTITATAQTTSPEARCPVCGHPAHRVQSRYVRTLADLPCSGQRIRWLIQVRRFWCENGACIRKIFTERLPACAPAYARRTVQQATILCELAFALGGKAGERITPHLGMAVSHDTLLRLMNRHGVPAVNTPLAIVTGGTPAAPIHIDVLASRSTNGGLTWGTPVIVRLGGPNSGLDKNWTVCDTTATSPFYGHCYTEYDNNNLLQMTTSSDGGKTWGLPKSTPNRALVIGGQPLVQPNGTVVVPIEVFNATFTVVHMEAFTSTNGGASWNNPVIISGIDFHTVAGNLRTSPLPSAEVDASGKVYVVWEDCRFEASCSANDIVLSTSTNGIAWSAVKRIPINPRGSGVDHFIPGIAVDRTTADGSAHIGLTYYYYPHANCSVATCQLDVGFISSINGGASWSKAEQLAGPMNLAWLPLTSQGPMVGDYISTSIVPGDTDANGVFEVAHPPTGAASCSDPGAVCDQDTFTTPEDLLQVVGGTNTSTGDPTVVATAQPGKFASTNY